MGAGAVLPQEDVAGIDHTICYYSKKFDKHQNNYSTLEIETLVLLLVWQQFEIYLGTTTLPVKGSKSFNFNS